MYEFRVFVDMPVRHPGNHDLGHMASENQTGVTRLETAMFAQALIWSHSQDTARHFGLTYIISRRGYRCHSQMASKTSGANPQAMA